MKKVLTAGLALFGMGIMTLNASAGEEGKSGVTIKGNARARIIYKDKYDFGNSDKDAASYGDSRVRFVVTGTAAGGAYVKSRLRLGDTKMDGAADPSNDKNIWVDYAYIGVPIGPTVVEAGKVKSNITRFLEWDQGTARLSVDWGVDNYNIIGFVDTEKEGQSSDVEIDNLEDNDWMMYGLIFKSDFSENCSAQLNLMYSDDQHDEYSSGSYVPDKSGFIGSVFMQGLLAGFQMETELAYKEANVLNSRDESSPIYGIPEGDADDGWGWYGQVDYQMGSVTPSLNVGLATNNFTVDNDFGWIMTGNGNNEPITVFNQLGGTGDWFWIAPSVSYAVSENLQLVGNLVWVNIDGNDNVATDDKRLANLMEISGSLRYTISKGVDFTWKAGYLQPDFDGRLDDVGVEDDGAFGTYAKLEVKF